MKTLKRSLIQFAALLGLLFLAACAASSPMMATEVVLAPTLTSTSVPLTNTPRPTETPLPTQTSTPTRVPELSVTLSISPSFILTTTQPSNLQIALYLSSRNMPGLPARLKGAPFNNFERQEIDVDDDGRADILVTGKIYDFDLYFAILGRNENGWQQRYYVQDRGQYCADARVKLVGDQVRVDILTCGGGTGIFGARWRQLWIRCRAGVCLLNEDRLIWQSTVYPDATHPLADLLNLPDEIQFSTGHVNRLRFVRDGP